MPGDFDRSPSPGEGEKIWHPCHGFGKVWLGAGGLWVHSRERACLPTPKGASRDEQMRAMGGRPSGQSACLHVLTALAKQAGRSSIQL